MNSKIVKKRIYYPNINLKILLHLMAILFVACNKLPETKPCTVDSDCGPQATCKEGFCSESYSCGNGRVEPQYGEECDNGLENGDTSSCSYGQKTCDICSTTCKFITQSGSYCGDYVIENGNGEQCDSLASFVCASCDLETCHTIAIKKATGTIEIKSANIDGYVVILNDGSSQKQFEIDLNGNCKNSEAICVSIDSTSLRDIALKLYMAIINDPIEIAPQDFNSSSALISLENINNGIIGNQPIIVTPSDGNIIVQGMSGGAGCWSGYDCSLDSDCILGECIDNKCK